MADTGMKLSKRTGLGLINEWDPEVYKVLQRKWPESSLPPPWQDLLAENPCVTPDSDLREGEFCSAAEEEQKKILQETDKNVLHLIKAINLHKV